MKKVVSLFLAIAMIIGCISVSAAYPTELLTIPSSGTEISNVGNINNDNSAWEFFCDMTLQNGTRKENVSFVLLDTNENGEYLIATQKHLSDLVAFDTDSSNGWVYDPTDVTNIAYRVNTYFPTQADKDAGFLSATGFAYYLGKSVYDHMVEKTWKIEASSTQGVDERTITAKVVLPSYTEYTHYRGKLNSTKAANNNNWYSVWLRTPSNFSVDVNSDGTAAMDHLRVSSFTGGNGQVTSAYLNSATCGVQCFFWVNADFFKDIKFKTIGSEVAKQIKEDLTLDELSVLYDTTELSTYFGINIGSENAPKISNMKVKTNINAIGGTATLSYVSAPESNSNKISWYIADDVQGTNKTKIEGLTTVSVKIPQAAAGKYLVAGITPISGFEIGNMVYSDGVKIEEALETFSSTVKPIADWNMSTSHNADYMFSTSWTNFVMLEAAEDGSDFLVIAQGDPWKSRIVPAGSGIITMDPAGNEYLPAFLNNEFLNIASDKSSDRYLNSEKTFITEADGAVGLPSNVSPYVNRKALWRTEASKLTPEYVFEAAVTVPSMTELKKHSNKIGTNVLPAWKTRTPVAGKDLDNNYLPMFVVVAGDPPQIATWHAGSNTSTLVTFRLNREFFINNKIGLTELEVNSSKAVMGDKVKEMLVANFARSELRQAGYSEEELDLIGFPNNEPEVKGLTAMGIASAAQTLTADFEYYDPNESEMTKAEYQWYYAETADGELFPIEGATNAKYKVANDLVGKYITVSVKVYNTENIKSATVKAPLVGPMGEREDIIVTPAEITASGASFVIDNALSTQDMVILYCVYNRADNSLAHIATEEIDVVNGEDTYSVTLTDFTVTSNHKAKAMLWDGLDTIRPYAMIELR